MVEETILKAAAETAVNEVTGEVAKEAAKTAIKETTKFGLAEGVVTGLTIIGGGTVIAGSVYLIGKGIKALRKHIKAKKGIPVQEAVEVEEKEVKVEEN